MKDMIINNIIKCNKCKAPLIQEELRIHECFTKTFVNLDMIQERMHIIYLMEKNGSIFNRDC